MKVILAVASTIVTALMLSTTASAGGNTVSFTDRQGDLGKPWYPGYDYGNHLFGDPQTWWSGNSPIANAGYLDMLSGWVSVKGNEITMGLEVASPLTDDSKLPNGAAEVRWAWFFYLNSEVLAMSRPNSVTYGVYILWDGADFTAAMVDRSSGSPPFVVTYLDDIKVEGTVLTATVGMDSMPGVVAWFSCTQVMYGSPWPLDQLPSMAAWGVPDFTDLQGPLSTYWPWQAMP
jgi:hypothetical protein